MRKLPDPTANQAVGNVAREWNKMAKLAEEIKRDPCSDWAVKQSARFTGIFRRLLEEPPARAGAGPS
ncbi:MAG: hypothetical protein II912_07110 [Clostridia bacterium]|nr:hypothetical protein [Clostridia bacterium]